jgi:hypothetical protein
MHDHRWPRAALAVPALLALALPQLALATPNRSVTAGAQIAADAFTFTGRVNAACTYHVVAQDGDDNRSGTSVSTAWATPAKAFRALQPGQTACVHAGTYNVGTLDPENAGTADAPIALIGAPGEARPVLRSNGNGALLNFGARDAFWVVQGLDLDKAQRAGATVQVLGSPVSASDPSAGPAHHVAIRQNLIHDGMSGAAVLIRGSATDVLVQSNAIYGQHLWVYGSQAAYTRRDDNYRRSDANGVNLEGTASGKVARVRIEANDIHDNGGDGLQCLGVHDTSGPAANDPMDLDIVDDRIHADTENAADIKSCQRVSIRGSKSPETAGSAAASKLYGFRPTDRTADVRGNSANGDAIVVHYNARGVEIKNTRIWDSCRGVGIGRQDVNGVRDVAISRTLMFNLVRGTNCDGVGIDLVLAQHVDLFHNTLDAVPDTAIRLASANGGAYTSNDVDVFNNLITGGDYWLDLYPARVAGFDSDRNLVWNADGSDSHMKLDFDRVLLRVWRDATAQDGTSVFADPGFVDDPTINDYYTQPGSPARDAALDIVGAARCGAGPDIGFRESGC